MLILVEKQIYIDVDSNFLKFKIQKHFKSKDVLNLIRCGLDLLCLKVTEISLVVKSAKFLAKSNLKIHLLSNILYLRPWLTIEFW